MELLQLYYFKAIAECQHITKAANKLMISQPSLSNTLSRIENEMGVQLFDRQGRNIVLNNYGRIVLEHTNNILRELDNIRTEIDLEAQRQSKVLTIASTDSMYLREWLPAFIQCHPDLILRHFVSTSAKIEAGLLDGTIDFGIFPTLSSNSDLEHLLLWHDEYVVLVPLGDPLADQEVRNFSDFAQMPFIALPRSENIPRSVDTLSQACGFKPNIIFEGERELLERILQSTRTAIVVLRSIFQTEADRKVCARYCSIVRLNNPEAALSINLAWDKRRSFSNTAQLLLEYMQTHPARAWHLNSERDALQD